MSAYEELKYQLRLRLVRSMGNGSDAETTNALLDRKAVSARLRQLFNALQRETPRATLTPAEQERLITEVADEVVGTGPLETLLVEPDVSEIMINGPEQVYVERHGRLERTTVRFRDEAHLMAVIERLLSFSGVSVTGAEPCVDATLPDGSRLNVIIPPLVLNGPTVTIRKKLQRWGMEDFLRLESLSPQAAEFLAAGVKAKVNLVVSGGTSTGKTTLVSILSSFIPPDERLITIENVAELELPNHEHWVRLVARSPNIEGRGEIPLRTLVRNALRMRPDRIVLGEARGGEALDVVQAMNSGHDGVITVLHATSPQAALERLQTLMLMSDLDLPPQACQIQVARAVDLIVHLARFADGSRRVASIAQVTGPSGSGFAIEEVFAFEMKSFRDTGALEGALRYTGVRPNCLQKLQLNNVPIPEWVTRD